MRMPDAFFSGEGDKERGRCKASELVFEHPDRVAVNIQIEVLYKVREAVAYVDVGGFFDNCLCVEIGENQPGLCAVRQAEFDPLVCCGVEHLPCFQEKVGVALMLFPLS